MLKAAGLVLERPQGTRRYYRLDPIGLVRLQRRLDGMWGLDAAEDAGAGPAARGRGRARPPPPRLRPAADDAAGKGDGKGGGKKRKKKRSRK